MIAVKLSDEGKVKEAEKIFLDNARTLREQGERWKSSDLYIQGTANMTLNDGNKARGTTWQTYRNAGQVMANGLNTQNRTSNDDLNRTLLNNGKSIMVPSGSTLTVPGAIKITPSASK